MGIQPATHKEIDLDALEHAGNNPDEGLLLESKEYLSSMKKAPMKDSEDPIQKLAKKSTSWQTRRLHYPRLFKTRPWWKPKPKTRWTPRPRPKKMPRRMKKPE